MAHATLAVGVAVLLEVAVGELPGRYHPVAALGAVIEFLDRPTAAPRLAGVGVALSLPLAVALLAAVPVWALESVTQYLAAALAGFILFTTVSLRLLLGLAGDVIAASETDQGTARDLVVGLVGRDTAALSGAELRSAAVESLAENLADGLVAPLLYFAVGSLLSLPVAVGAAVWVKAVNTLDSMWGYPDRPLGTASARLDDLAEWVPARVSAALIAVAAGDPRTVLRARRWAREPSSPNSGWPMATMAAALETQLRKPGAYAIEAGASLPDEPTAKRGITVGRRAGALAFALAGVIAWF
jgi:adenosylcobinamide-phosphate synthase